MNADFVKAEILWRRKRDGTPGLWLVGRLRRDPETRCSWCGDLIAEGDPKRVSHGICVPCAREHFPSGPH